MATALSPASAGELKGELRSATAPRSSPLDRLRGWLTQNNATVMAVLLVAIGVVLLGKGTSGLTS